MVSGRTCPGKISHLRTISYLPFSVWKVQLINYLNRWLFDFSLQPNIQDFAVWTKSKKYHKRDTPIKLQSKKGQFKNVTIQFNKYLTSVSKLLNIFSKSFTLQIGAWLTSSAVKYPNGNWAREIHFPHDENRNHLKRPFKLYSVTQ